MTARRFLVFILLAGAVTLVGGLLVSCGSGGGGGTAGAPSTAAGGDVATTTSASETREAPAIVITSPSGRGSFTTRATSLAIAGWATSSVTSVTCSGPNGYAATAQGTLPAWTCPDLPLAGGDNRFVFTGTGDDGASATTSVIVVSNPFIEMSELTAAPDFAFVNEARQVAFSITLEDVAGLDPNRVEVFEADANGLALGKLGRLADGGAVQGTRTFSGQFSLTRSTPATLYFRVSAVVGEKTALSSLRAFHVVRHVTEADMQVVLTTLEAARQVYRATLERTGLTTAAATAVVDFAKKRAGIRGVASSPDGESVTILFTSGVTGSVSNDRESSRGGPPLARPQGPREGKSRAAPTREASSKTAFGALVLAPSHTEFQRWGDSELSSIMASLDEVKCLTPCSYSDASANLAQYRSPMVGNRVIYFESHGRARLLFTIGPKQQNSPEILVIYPQTGETEGYRPTGAPFLVTFRTGQTVTPQVDEVTQRDIQMGFVVADSKFAITPSFIDHYQAQGLSDCVIVASLCSGAQNSTMARSFLALGAKAYLGYHRPVDTKFAARVGRQYIAGLVGGKTVREAYDAVPTKVDPYTRDPRYAARFTLWGDGDFKITDCPDLVLDPSSVPIDPTQGTPAQLTLKASNYEVTTRSPFRYHWQTGGAYGHLEDADGQSGKEFISYWPRVTYVPDPCPEDNGRDAGKDTVTVEVLLTNPCTGETKIVGMTEATASIGSCPTPSPSPTTWTITPTSTAPAEGEPVTFRASGPAPPDVVYYWGTSKVSGTFRDNAGHSGANLTTTASQVTFTPGTLMFPYATGTVYFQSMKPAEGGGYYVLGNANAAVTVNHAPCGELPADSNSWCAPVTVTPRELSPGDTISISYLQNSGSLCWGGTTVSVTTATWTDWPGYTVVKMPGTFTSYSGGALVSGNVLFPNITVDTTRVVTFQLSTQTTAFQSLLPCPSLFGASQTPIGPWVEVSGGGQGGNWRSRIPLKMRLPF